MIYCVKRLFKVVLISGLLLLNSISTFAQSYILKGTVVDRDSSFALPNSYAVNKKTFAGTVTNGLGYFEISVHQGDTIIFSNVGYQFKYLAIDSAVLSKIKEDKLIKLVQKNFLLDEVSIYAITSNNPRTMPQAKPRVPSNADIRIPEAVAPTLANPLDLLYYRFGKRPRQLAALQKLRQEDYYRRKLEEGNNREILEELTGIPKAEMEAFMFYCKYSDAEIRTFNDYQFLVSLLDCYASYEREKEHQEATKNYK
tara:strand:- start:6401 stop:7165 length:765 start_codon:yes stop_codon:yes gene_type:complete